MGNLYDLFKNENGDYILISLEELKSKLDFNKWYFTSKMLYDHYKFYLQHTSYNLHSIIDIKSMFQSMAFINNGMVRIPNNYA